MLLSSLSVFWSFKRMLLSSLLVFLVIQAHVVGCYLSSTAMHGRSIMDCKIQYCSILTRLRRNTIGAFFIVYQWHHLMRLVSIWPAVELAVRTRLPFKVNSRSPLHCRHLPGWIPWQPSLCRQQRQAGSMCAQPTAVLRFHCIR